MRFARWVSAPLLLGVAVAAHAVPELRFNPFERPDLAAGRQAGGYGEPVSGGAWRPVLRATLVDGKASLANLGGTVLRLGEETQGYRLREVRTWEAVFEKGDATLVIPVETIQQLRERGE